VARPGDLLSIYGSEGSETVIVDRRYST